MKIIEPNFVYLESIMDTVREPLVVLDDDLRVLTASRSFYRQNQLKPEETVGRLIFESGNGQWNIPELKRLLETIIQNRESIEDFELRHHFNNAGERIMLLNLRHVANESDNAGIILIAIKEITERKQESIRIERGRLRATLESIPDEFWITDAQGNIIERSLDQIQYSLGKSDWPNIYTALQELELLNPDGTHRSPEDAALPRALRGEITQKMPEMIRNLKTGELRWREVSSSPIRDEKGSIIGAVAIARDITERKRAEEELHKSEQRFRALATAGFSVVYRMSPDWSEMWQLSGSNFLADTTESNSDWLKEYIPAQEHSQVLSAIDKAILKKSIFELEHRVIQADGSIGWTHSRAVPLIDSKGEISEWFGTARDITGNKQAEQALVESERNLEEAQRITHVGSWKWNIETSEILCSAETYRIYGEEPFSLQVTENIYLEYVHPEDRVYVKSLITELKAGLKNRLNLEFRIIRKDGAIRHIHSVGEVSEFTIIGKPRLITGTGQDITERKLLEKKLEDERDFVTAVIQTSGALITVIGLDGTITRFNKACEELTGYTADEVIGRSVFDLFIPMEEREDVIGVAARLFAGERWVEYENHWITKNGERRFIRWRNSILFDNKGHPVHAIATGIDITDRKRAEEALRESEASLKRSQEIAHLGSWELDLVANRLTWSDEIYRLFGQQPQAFGATYEAFLEHVHPDDRAAVDAAYKRSVQEGRDSYEIEHRVLLEATGEIRFVQEKCYHIRDANGKIIRSVGMVHDITDRKQAEVELRESQERFAASFRSIQDALIISDPETGLIIDINQTWISHWGYSEEESIGYRSTELGIFTDVVDRDRAMQIFRKEGRLSDFEILLRTKSGEIRNAILFVEQLMLPQKSLMLTIIHDITERKRAEDALQTRTKELELANRDLESFSYSVSHDLRSPLSAIQGFTDILLEDYGNKLDEHGRSILNHITNASNKMASIMADLLNLARISREKMHCHEIDLSPIVNSVINELRQSEPQRNVVTNIANTIPTHADPRLMTIALRNLIENAWKYTGKNPNARIDIGIVPNGNKNTFFIQDNGAGFDMNSSHKLFQPFERLHSDSKFSGTGIGLAIVQRIMQRQGGRIWAESETGKGSTFFFTLDCPQS